MKKILSLFFVSVFAFSTIFAKTDYKLEFQKAIDKNDSEKITKLMKKCSETDKTEALLYAVLHENKEIVVFLLDSGILVDSKDNLNSTPLIKACSRSGNKEIVRILLEHGANVNAKNDIFTTPLIAALRIPNNDAVVKLLLDYGADINARLTNDGKTPLMLAVEANDLDTTMLYW